MTNYAKSLGSGKSRMTPRDEGILSCVGETPMVRLNRLFPDSDMTLYAKLECYNPGGSAKDRPATRMIEEALREGRIKRKSTVVESSSGNMGIGLAQACRYYGMHFICVVDPNAQSLNVEIMRAHGAEIILVEQPVNDDFLTARLEKVQSILTENTDAYWPNQYANQNNPQAHYDGSILEIDQALDGKLDYLFVATSSTGTARGCRDYLKDRGLSTRVVAVDAENSVLFGGKGGSRKISGLGAGVVPPLAQGQTFDRIERVDDLDCVIGCRRIARDEAILVGGSAGGLIETIGRMQDELAGKTAVAIFHDSGERYVRTIFSDQWVEENLGCPSSEIERRINCTFPPALDE